MVEINRLVNFLDRELKIADFEDKSWNGLQVEGNKIITRVAFAVNSGLNSITQASKENADMLIVHHGLFWKTSNPSVTSSTREKIRLMLKNDISLYAAHLPLDAHPVIGNNAQLLKLLGAKKAGPFGLVNKKQISWFGKLSMPLRKVTDILETRLDAKCITLSYGRQTISKIAVMSGGGSYADFFESVAGKVDLYLTGDRVDVYDIAKDEKINVIFAGHYATETVGLKALAKLLEKRFKVETTFIEVPTGL